MERKNQKHQTRGQETDKKKGRNHLQFFKYLKKKQSKINKKKVKENDEKKKNVNKMNEINFLFSSLIFLKNEIPFCQPLIV